MTEASAQGEANHVRNKYCLLFGLAMIAIAVAAGPLATQTASAESKPREARSMAPDRVVAGGMLFSNSGYPRTGRMPDNLLLAFVPE